MRFRFIIPIAVQHSIRTNIKEVEAQVDRDILVVCSKHPLSSSEIASALGHKKLSGNVRKALSRLKQAGLLEFTIPDKPKSKLQKHRLTTTKTIR